MTPADRSGSPAPGPPSTLRNLGPTTDALLAEAGIATADEVRRLGAPMAFALVRHHVGRRATLHLLYALEGALADRHWASFSPDEKAALRAAATEDVQTRPGTAGRRGG